MAHTREVSKAMVESCQFREVPSQGIVIRGRYVCVCVSVYACFRNKLKKKKNVCRTAFRWLQKLNPAQSFVSCSAAIFDLCNVVCTVSELIDLLILK